MTAPLAAIRWKASVAPSVRPLPEEREMTVATGLLRPFEGLRSGGR